MVDGDYVVWVIGIVIGFEFLVKYIICCYGCWNVVDSGFFFG